MLPYKSIDLARRGAWSEVQNYIHALDFAIKELATLPLSMRLLKEAHRILFSGVRGASKTSGELRGSQNWIGGSSLASASFIPPHHDELPGALSDLEAFWHNRNIKTPHLYRAAISHYQFETIHPFLDGNGRIGRLLITLYLISANILRKPTLYLSAFFERHRDAYYNALAMTRVTHNLEQWVRFFLTGVIETAQDSIDTFKRVIALRQKYDQRIVTRGGVMAKKAQRFLPNLFLTPIVSVSQVAKVLGGVSFNSAGRLIHWLCAVNVLTEITARSRNRYFALDEYLALFRG